MKIYGWFDEENPKLIKYDPPHDLPCLFCGANIFSADVRTISLLREGDARSYFYRVHRTCHKAATEIDRFRIDGLIFDALDGRAA